MTAPSSPSGLVLDLFAGPGGWDLAAVALGIDTVGVEFDDAARATREAAGLTTADIKDVRDFYDPDDRFVGLIASPPCQTFSMAGKGAGRAALDAVIEGIGDLLGTGRIDYGRFDDERTGLVLEPLRYALAAFPEWIAWEQVPTVQPVWDECAAVLRGQGYSVWTGVLHAEQYGVPQTRKRAVLIASRVREVGKPKPTHSRYYPRNPTKLDPGVKPWVSMAEALGWADDTVVRSNYGTGGDPAQRGERTASQPAGTVTSKVDRNLVVSTGNNSYTVGPGYRDTGLTWQEMSQPYERSVDVPSPTVDCKAPGAWFVHPPGERPRFAGAGATSEQTAGQIPREPEQPAHTLTGKGTAAWVHNRPSTTIVGSFKPEVVAAPGYRTTVSRQNAEGSVRVTVQEAGVLQSFPPEYPWQGTKTKQYQQVGNAIPPLLAAHVLMEAAGIAIPGVAGWAA